MCVMDKIIEQTFTTEELDTYKKIRALQQNIGRYLEDYINTKITDDITFVGRDKNRPEGVDYIVNDVLWSVKNAWNTENQSMKKYREDRNIRHWYRLNRDYTTNWHTFFIEGLSENEFREYINVKPHATLEEFYE
jgi:hypothetical protein